MKRRLSLHSTRKITINVLVSCRKLRISLKRSRFIVLNINSISTISMLSFTTNWRFLINGRSFCRGLRIALAKLVCIFLVYVEGIIVRWGSTWWMSELWTSASISTSKNTIKCLTWLRNCGRRSFWAAKSEGELVLPKSQLWRYMVIYSEIIPIPRCHQCDIARKPRDRDRPRNGQRQKRGIICKIIRAENIDNSWIHIGWWGYQDGRILAQFWGGFLRSEKQFLSLQFQDLPHIC